MIMRVQAEFKNAGPGASFQAVSDQSTTDFQDRFAGVGVYQQ
jgi:hypothetical protein